MIEEAFDAFARSVAAHVACEITPCPVYLAPDRFVTIKLHAAVSGYSEAAIRSKIKNGVWIEAASMFARLTATFSSTAKGFNAGSSGDRDEPDR